MYERTFGTEWDELTRREAIDRAFALGVAAGCGREDREEYERVVDGVPSAYDRSLVELAYDEGRTKALESPNDGDAVWEELVDEAGVPKAPPVPAAMPGAIQELTLLEKPESGPPSSLDLPSLLRK